MNRLWTISMLNSAGLMTNYPISAPSFLKAWQNACSQAGVPFDAGILSFAAGCTEPQTVVQGSVISAVVT